MPGRPNLLARFDGPPGCPTLMMECHSDTVSIDGMTVPPFEATLRGGKLYGRGACDDKGPMAAMLLAIRGLLDEAAQLPVSVLFAAACGEELGAIGAKALVKNGAPAAAVVVGEPTDLKIVHASKGVVRFNIETRGRAAHSSNPSAGDNAIYSMRRVLQTIEEQVFPPLAKSAHPLLGPPTMSVGTILGGSQVNIVPDRCTIEIDRRTLPGEKPEQVAAEVFTKLDELKKLSPIFEYSGQYCETFPPLWTDPQSSLARLVSLACHQTLGASELAVAPWASDAAVYAAAGMEAVLVGPGSIRQAHTADEFIELEQVVAAAQMYARIILLYGARQN